MGNGEINSQCKLPFEGRDWIVRSVKLSSNSDAGITCRFLDIIPHYVLKRPDRNRRHLNRFKVTFSFTRIMLQMLRSQFSFFMKYRHQ